MTVSMPTKPPEADKPIGSDAEPARDTGIQVSIGAVVVSFLTMFGVVSFSADQKVYIIAGINVVLPLITAWLVRKKVWSPATVEQLKHYYEAQHEQAMHVLTIEKSKSTSAMGMLEAQQAANDRWRAAEAAPRSVGPVGQAPGSSQRFPEPLPETRGWTPDWDAPGPAQASGERPIPGSRYASMPPTSDLPPAYPPATPWNPPEGFGPPGGRHADVGS